MARATSVTVRATGKTYKVKPLSTGRPYQNYKNLASRSSMQGFKGAV